MVSRPHHPGPIFLSMLVCEHPLLIGLPNIHTILWEWFCHAKRREYHFPHFGYHVFINTAKDHMIFPGRHIELLYSLLKRPMLFTHTSSKSCPHINIPVWSSHLQVGIFMSPPSISFCWHLFTVPASADRFGSGFSDLLVYTVSHHMSTGRHPCPHASSCKVIEQDPAICHSALLPGSEGLI